MKKIFILTGEASGDKLASKVISDLNQLNSSEFILLLEKYLINYS